MARCLNPDCTRRHTMPSGFCSDECKASDEVARAMLRDAAWSCPTCGTPPTPVPTAAGEAQMVECCGMTWTAHDTDLDIPGVRK